MRAILEDETIFSERLPEIGEELEVIYKGVPIGNAIVEAVEAEKRLLVSFDFIGPSIKTKWSKSFVSKENEN
jgi:hypothetical protein